MQLQTMDDRRRGKKVWQYLLQVDRFLELLMGCVHVEYGQPGRGSEITTMRHRNGLLQDRNIHSVDVPVLEHEEEESHEDRNMPAREEDGSVKVQFSPVATERVQMSMWTNDRLKFTEKMGT